MEQKRGSAHKRNSGRHPVRAFCRKWETNEACGERIAKHSVHGSQRNVRTLEPSSIVRMARLSLGGLSRKLASTEALRIERVGAASSFESVSVRLSNAPPPARFELQDALDDFKIYLSDTICLVRNLRQELLDFTTSDRRAEAEPVDFLAV